MSAFTGDLSPTPRYIHDPNFRIKVGKYYQLLSEEYVYIKLEKKSLLRAPVLTDQKNRKYSRSGFSLEPGQGYTGSVWREVNQEDYLQSIMPVATEPKDSKMVEETIDLKVGYTYLTYNNKKHTIISRPKAGMFKCWCGYMFNRSGKPLNVAYNHTLEKEVGPTPELSLEYGKSYLNRVGDVRTLISGKIAHPDSDYFMDTGDRCYDSKGRYGHPNDPESDYDLITEVECTSTDTLNSKPEVASIPEEKDGALSVSFVQNTAFLTTEDIFNIALYVDKIEQIVNKVGLDLEIRLTPTPKEGS